MIEKYKQMSFDLKPVNLSYDQDAKAKFTHHRQEGDWVKCPCCGKTYNTVYKRRIYKSLVTGLRNLVRRNNVTSSLSDFSKLRYWGLIEPTTNKGHWRITQDGRDFLDGTLEIPEYVIVQNNAVLGYSKDKVSVYEITD